MVGKSLHWDNITIILFNAKVGIFPPSYAVIPLFISCFTTFYRLDSYFIFKLIYWFVWFFVVTYSYTRVTVLRVTVVLEYLESARGCTTIHVVLTL